MARHNGRGGTHFEKSGDGGILTGPLAASLLLLMQEMFKSFLGFDFDADLRIGGLGFRKETKEGTLWNFNGDLTGMGRKMLADCI